MKRPDKVSGGNGDPGVPMKGELFSHLPLIWEMMTASRYDDGTKRHRSTILLVADGEAAKICFLDGDIGRQAWSTGETFEQALATLEEQLERGSVSWQPGKRKEERKNRN